MNTGDVWFLAVGLGGFVLLALMAIALRLLKSQESS